MKISVQKVVLTYVQYTKMDFINFILKSWSFETPDIRFCVWCVLSLI